MSVPTVALKDKGGNVELKVEDNKEFQVALEGNGTTGYCWIFVNVDEVKNSNVVEPLNVNPGNMADDYIEKPHEQGIVGVGGCSVFKFKVKNAAGKTLPKLVFEHKRPWEKNKTPIGKAEITLKL